MFDVSQKNMIDYESDRAVEAVTLGHRVNYFVTTVTPRC